MSLLYPCSASIFNRSYSHLANNMCGVWVCVIFVAVSACVLKLFFKVYGFYRDFCVLKKIPQTGSHLLWGHLLEFPGLDEGGLEYLREKTKHFPKCFLFWLGPSFSLLVVTHPQTARCIINSTDSKADKASALSKNWLGDGLLLNSGSKWHRNRRLLTPAFHSDVLKSYVSLKNQAVNVLLEKIERYANKGEYFEVFSNMSLLTLDILLKCAFSYNTDCQNIGENHQYVKAVNRLTWLSVERFMRPWLHSQWLFYLTPYGREYRKLCDFVHKVTEDAIDARRKTLQESGGGMTHRKNMDFLDILLTARDESGQGLTSREIRDEADNFMFAGHDTTASALSWTMFSLAEHPECQEKVYREVEELMATKKDTDVQIQDLSKVPYLTMCIKESLRLHPPIPVITRQSKQKFKVNDHELPVNSMIIISIYSIHHHQELWPDSLEFRPERFLPENSKDRHPFSFVPFSAGPRNCIGQNFAMNEMKITLVKLIYRFRFELDPNQVVKKKFDAVMKAEDGIRIKAIRRIK